MYENIIEQLQNLNQRCDSIIQDIREERDLVDDMIEKSRSTNTSLIKKHESLKLENQQLNEQIEKIKEILKDNPPTSLTISKIRDVLEDK